jgi:hypothetical protein
MSKTNPDARHVHVKKKKRVENLDIVNDYNDGGGFKPVKGGQGRPNKGGAPEQLDQDPDLEELLN